KELLKSLSVGVNVSAALIALSSLAILYIMGFENFLGLWGSIVTGLAAGIAIGQSTEYFTASAYRPTQKIAEACQTGPATTIISGMGVGLVSTAIPLGIIVVGITMAYLFSAGFTFDAAYLNYGLYGVGIAAVGMLSTLGITLATDAYGPIADNAGGIAQMSKLGDEVRRRTDALDSLGNTTAATGKGFAIGSAALTALALLAAYFEEVKMMFVKFLDSPNYIIMGRNGEIQAKYAQFIDFIYHYEIHLMNPKVLVGVFLGVMSVFLFCGMTMNAVGRAARSMVEEVRRQFRTIPGILEGKAEPDYERCVAISTKGAQREMLAPAIVALIIPIVVGFVFGVAGVAGLLIGTITSGFALAIFMANAGGAWDNAKKYIEAGNLGGKGSDAHKAAVVGDTVGDPFKDTAGPSLNILIKLMAMASVVTVGVAVSYSLL
ncbi:MAG TPA: sodium/proton-translocating pyrophosphatase, partial [Bacteroidales bacterium]|nr:sodium/proton-translocating pyrophosphatase [Bacteroidales bacterium]